MSEDSKIVENSGSQEMAAQDLTPDERGWLGSVVGGVFGGPVGAAAGNYIEDKLKSKFGKKDESKQKQEQKQDQKNSGNCSSGSGGAGDGNASSSDSAGDYPSGADPESIGDVGLDDVDDSLNSMCKKTYTVFRAIKKDFSCPCAQRDNVSDQFTPQDELLTMEKTTRDFLKLEGKIYDPESTNPRFFASEGWVQQYEKDKNVVLAALDQYKANILRMEHLYTVVDNNSYSKLLGIPNQDDKESYQTNILWTARSLKDWANNWFIKRNSLCSTPLEQKDHWLPGLTGKMVSWMKLGTYVQYAGIQDVSNLTTIRKIDRLEGVIDRLISGDAVANTISNFVNLKETLQKDAELTKERTFTSKVIDSQMGKKLGVKDTGKENHEVNGQKYKKPDDDKVEQFSLQEKLSSVKKLFKEFREKANERMKKQRGVSPSGSESYADIWTNIDTLADPVYTDLDILNELIHDEYDDFENPQRHCGITNSNLSAIQLRKRVAAFKCIIEKGVLSVMLNQAMMPKKGLDIMDSMFNQLWEYGEKGPTVELPSWCQMAIDSINAFERSMLDAWSEVYDCWEREFITRLWDIEVDHHSSNFERTQTKYVKTLHNHQHPFVPLTMMTLASIGGDTKNSDITPLKGVLTCPGHLDKLMKPVCVQYRVFNIAHLARNYRTDIKSLCQWMCAAIEAVGIKLTTISAVMSDPTLNGECNNVTQLKEICELREKNNKLLEKVEKAYGIYSDVDNMKNKKEYDEEIALHELQPNKFSNEDQLNMTSSVQTESKETGMDMELCEGQIDIEELKPWNHLTQSEIKKEAKKLPIVKACNKFMKLIKSIANFEGFFNSK